MECLSILDAVFLAQSTAAGEDEFPDVIAVGSHVVVPQERELLAAFGELGPEPRAEIARWPLRPVGAIGVDGLIDHSTHVHDAVDLRTTCVVVLFLHRVRREASGELFGVIMRPARHPAGGFYAASDLDVIGILLVMRPRVPAYHRI